MARVLILSTTTGYQIRSFGEAAKALGVGLVFGSDRCDQLEDPWWDQAIPIRFHERERSVDAIVRACAGDPPIGVLAVGDRPTLLAAQVAAALQLPGNPPEAAAASRNKLASRALFKGAGLPTPWFATLSLESDPRPRSQTLSYPVVLKPLALSGSRGVMRADDAEGLVAALARLKSILHAPDVQSERDPVHDLALVESFIPGEEFAVEGLLQDGTLRVLAIFDKPDALDGPFFEETVYLAPSRAPAAAQQRMTEAVARAAQALGLRHGPVHAECRVSPSRMDGQHGEGDVYVLEVAPRPIGGLCSRALRFTGRGRTVSLEEVLLRHAIGEDVSVFTREAAASGVMMIPIPKRGVFRGVGGVARARGVPGIDDVLITAKEDTVLVPLPEGRSYLGFIFAHGATPADAERALRRAHGSLELAIERDIVLATRNG